MAYNPKARRMRRNRDLQRKRSLAGVAARERNRLARAQECEAWETVGHFCLTVTASADNLAMGLQVWGPSGLWTRTGTHRACVAALARMIEEARKRAMNRKQPPVTGELPASSRAVARGTAAPSADGGSL